MAYIAYHFHWSRDEILSLAHRERHVWVQEISEINKKINKQSGTAGGAWTPPGMAASTGAGGLNLDFR